jgi:hypothetical protein
MASFYYKNNNRFQITVPTVTGVSMKVDPGFYVVDATGTGFYKKMDILSDQGTSSAGVTAFNVAYTYPASAVGFSGYSGVTGASGWSGISGYSGHL